MSDKGYKVRLHMYDITRGMARMFSQQFIGKQLEGVWHTGVVVYGKEYFWGGIIQQEDPGATHYGIPTKTIDIGETFIPKDLFDQYIAEISVNYNLSTYNLLNNNCNNFSNEVCTFLTGTGIPADITGLPDEILRTPFGQMIKPLLEQMENSVKSQYALPETLAYRNAQLGGGNTHQQPVTPKAQTLVATDPTSQPNAPSLSLIERHKDVIKNSEWIKDKPKPILGTQGSVPSVITKIKQSKSIALLIGDQLILDQLQQLLTGADANVPLECVELIARIISKCDESEIFHVLYLLRLFVARKGVANYYAKHQGEWLKNIFVKYFANSQPKPVQLMAILLAINMFSDEAGAEFMLSEPLCGVIDSMIEALSSSHSDVRLTVSSLVYNYSIYLPKKTTEAELCFCSILEHLQTEGNSNEELNFRLLCSLGQLVLFSTELVSFAFNVGDDYNLQNLASWQTIVSSKKNTQVAKEIVKLVYNK